MLPVGGAPLGLGQVPSLDFWVPLKRRQRLQLAPGPPITGCRGYGPDPDWKKENIISKISLFFSSLDCP